MKREMFKVMAALAAVLALGLAVVLLTTGAATTTPNSIRVIGTNTTMGWFYQLNFSNVNMRVNGGVLYITPLGSGGGGGTGSFAFATSQFEVVDDTNVVVKEGAVLTNMVFRGTNTVVDTNLWFALGRIHSGTNQFRIETTDGHTLLLYTKTQTKMSMGSMSYTFGVDVLTNASTAYFEHLHPRDTATRDLGTAALYWRTGYVGVVLTTNISAESANVSGSITGAAVTATSGQFNSSINVDGTVTANDLAVGSGAFEVNGSGNLFGKLASFDHVTSGGISITGAAPGAIWFPLFTNTAISQTTNFALNFDAGQEQRIYMAAGVHFAHATNHFSGTNKNVCTVLRNLSGSSLTLTWPTTWKTFGAHATNDMVIPNGKRVVTHAKIDDEFPTNILFGVSVSN